MVAEGYDPVKEETFYRPLGGGIEFGGTSSAALVREIREEVGAEVTDLRHIGTLENIFTYACATGYEIVQVYDGRFLDESLYAASSVPGVESNGGADEYRLDVCGLECSGALITILIARVLLSPRNVATKA